MCAWRALAASLHVLCVLSRDVPHFTVDLDAPATERWREVTERYVWTSSALAASFREFLSQNIADEDLPRWESVVRAALTPEQLLEAEAEFNRTQEMTGDTSLKFQEALISQAMYEMQYSRSACSGVLAAMEDGTVVHGRNMDYSLPFYVNGTKYDFPDVTFEVTFVRDGAPLMTSVSWPGQMGIHTAMRFDGWTFEQNTRFIGNNRTLNLESGLRGGLPFGIFARQIMENTSSFEDAKEAFRSAKFMAPSYFIMSGAGSLEGAELTIARDGGSGCGQELSEEGWRLLQTNDDWCGAALDLRRPLANQALPSRLPDQGAVNSSSVMSFMTAPPLKHPGTAFTWVAVPATGYHATVAHFHGRGGGSSLAQTTGRLREATLFRMRKMRVPPSGLDIDP